MSDLTAAQQELLTKWMFSRVMSLQDAIDGTKPTTASFSDYFNPLMPQESLIQLAEVEQKNGLSFTEAIEKVFKENPHLYEAYRNNANRSGK